MASNPIAMPIMMMARAEYRFCTPPPKGRIIKNMVLNWIKTKIRLFIEESYQIYSNFKTIP